MLLETTLVIMLGRAPNHLLFETTSISLSWVWADLDKKKLWSYEKGLEEKLANIGGHITVHRFTHPRMMCSKKLHLEGTGTQVDTMERKQAFQMCLMTESKGD